MSPPTNKVEAVYRHLYNKADLDNFLSDVQMDTLMVNSSQLVDLYEKQVQLHLMVQMSVH